MISAFKKIISTSPDKLAEEIEALKLERREWERGLGTPAFVAHRQVDELVALAKEVFEASFSSPGRIPTVLHHEMIPGLVAAAVFSAPDFAARAHAAVDAALGAGAYSSITDTEIEDRRAAFSRDIEARTLALRRHEQSLRAQAEAEALADLDREAAEVMKS